MKYIIFLILFSACSRCCQVNLDDMPCGYIEEKECSPTDEALLITFWQQFNDPLLTFLIEQAFCANRDYRIAQERVYETRNIYLEEVARLLPQIDATFLALRERNTLTDTDSPFLGGMFFNLFQAGLFASWEIDFFGKRRDYARAAYYEIAATAASKYALQLIIASEIATHYMAVAAAYERIAVDKKLIVVEKELLDIAEIRFKAGLVTEKDVCNARALLENREASIFFNQILAKRNIYAIALLTGQTPENTYCLFSECLLIPDAIGIIPCTVPCELLSRRPDIREAEFRLFAQGARVRGARKELFPTISLVGFYSYESSFLNKLFKPESRFWSISPIATMPVFRGGGIYANIEVQTSRQRQAVYAYEQSVLAALKDVETAMALYFGEEPRLKHLLSSLEGSKCALEISKNRYEAGLIDFRNVMEDERDLHNASVLAIESKKNLMVGLISIYKALGGGWDWRCFP